MIVLIGHQITSFAYPGVDMIGQMGLAHASNIKPMMKLSYFAIIPGHSDPRCAGVVHSVTSFRK